VSRRSVILAAVLATALISTVIFSTFWILRQPVPETTTVSIPTVDGSEVSLEEVEALDSDPDEPEDGKQVDGHIQVKLYVVARSGRRLATESQEIPLEPSVQQQASEVVELLLRRSAAFPLGVKLLEIFITSQGVAYVDLSKELISNHPGGSSAEELTVFSLTSTLVANFPAIKTVKLLVEGREIQTIAGHLDLTLPYGRAPAYLEPDSEHPDTLNEAS
jgi:germination protein M